MTRVEIIGLNYRRAVIRMTDETNDSTVVFTVSNDGDKSAYEALNGILKVAATNLAARAVEKELGQFAKVADIHCE